MPYNITKANGDPITIADNAVDYSQLTIGLVGKNFVGYGDDIAFNFVRILENSANASAPPNSTPGQLWYNTSEGVMKVCSSTGAWLNLNSSSASASQPLPAESAVGDLWFNTVTGKLEVYTGTAWEQIGDDPAGAISLALANVIRYSGSSTIDSNPVGPGYQHEPTIYPIEPSLNSNLAIGKNAMSDPAMSDSWYNTAFGINALSKEVNGNSSTAIGFNAGANATGELNAMFYDSPGVITQLPDPQGWKRGRNTLIGDGAGENITDSWNSVAIGYHAMQYANPMNYDLAGTVAIGPNALKHVTGMNNIAVGPSALRELTLGANNVALGVYSMSQAITSDMSVAIGRSALYYGTTASHNIGVGGFSGVNNLTGDKNICIGYNSMAANLSGDSNICIGHQADVSSATATQQIVIGYQLNGTADNRVHIGNATNAIYADFAGAGAWATVSDVRRKTEIQDDTLGLEFINGLRPVTYKWKAAADLDETLGIKKDAKIDTETVMHGMIAQEVKAELDKAGVNTFAGHGIDSKGVQSLSREMFITPLINAIQELTKQNEELLKRIEQLENK